MSSVGPNSPNLFADDSSNGGTTAWSSVSNIANADSTYASASTTNSDTTHYLIARGFNLAVPSSATINGITVEIRRRTDKDGFGSATVIDDTVKLLKANVVVGEDKANTSGTAWSSSDTYATYGGSSDLWETTWTGPEVRASGFGVVLAAHISGGNGTLTTKAYALVDHVRVTITYTYAGNTKSVASTVSLSPKMKRGISLNLASTLSSATSILRGNLTTLSATATVTANVAKGLSIALVNTVKAKAVLHKLRASTAHIFPRSIRMWVWLKQELEEDDWIT